MSLDTLLEAAKYLDHIENRENGWYGGCDEDVLECDRYHLKVDPNLPISVQFHTYTSTYATTHTTHEHSIGAIETCAQSQHESYGTPYGTQHEQCDASQPSPKSTNRGESQQSHPQQYNNIVNLNLKNKDHSSYSRHREMHKTLEKNRRAHLRHCFEILKQELPPNEYNEKKTSHINIIRCAIRYIQHLKRTEFEQKSETDRLIRSKIRFQNQIAQLNEDLRDLANYRNKSDIEIVNNENNTNNRRHLLGYQRITGETDEQSDGDVIIELDANDDVYDDETTTTASECADDVRENGSSSKISGSLSSALIYKCHA